jgi:hypothetical protein
MTFTGKVLPIKYERILLFPEKAIRPSHMLICDDCQGTNMYSNARNDLMSHIAIKQRHIPSLWLFGCSHGTVCLG